MEIFRPSPFEHCPGEQGCFGNAGYVEGCHSGDGGLQEGLDCRVPLLRTIASEPCLEILARFADFSYSRSHVLPLISGSQLALSSALV